MNVSAAPLQRTSLRDQLSQRLEQMILRHDIAPGEHLPSERELVEKWGVSRAVVRDAIRTLESQGLVEVRQGVGAVVQGDVRDAFARALDLLIERGNYRVSELMHLRTVLEVEAARLAAQRATDEDLERMDAALARFGEAIHAGDIQGVIGADRAFHLHLIAATHTEPLIDLIAPLVRSFMAKTIVSTVQQWDTRARNLREHRCILDGIRQRDAEQAVHWMRTTLDNSRINLSEADVPAGDAISIEECVDL